MQRCARTTSSSILAQVRRAAAYLAIFESASSARAKQASRDAIKL